MGQNARVTLIVCQGYILLHRVILEYLNFGGNWIPFDEGFHTHIHTHRDLKFSFEWPCKIFPTPLPSHRNLPTHKVGQTNKRKNSCMKNPKFSFLKFLLDSLSLSLSLSHTHTHTHTHTHKQTTRDYTIRFTRNKGTCQNATTTILILNLTFSVWKYSQTQKTSGLTLSINKLNY